MSNSYEVKGDTAYISLGSRKQLGLKAIISTTDLKKVMEVNTSWYAAFDKTTQKYYVKGNILKENGKKTAINLHRFILDCPSNMVVDHVNMDPLDNRRENIRIVTRAENNQNLKAKVTCKTGYRGVFKPKARNNYTAYGRINGKFTHIGVFKTPEEANEAAKAWRKENMPFSREAFKHEQ